MLKGFKDFIFRGNVLDLAIAVVIGTAFTAVVTSIVEHLIQPIINSLGGHSVGGLSFHLVSGNDGTVVDVSAIITAIINFLIIAAVVYFVLVVPSQRLLALRAAKTGQAEEATPVASEDVLLLREIRDLLVTQGGGGTPARTFE